MHFEISLVLKFSKPCCPICNQYHCLDPFTLSYTLFDKNQKNWGEACSSCYNLPEKEIQQKLLQNAKFEASMAKEIAQLAQEPVHKDSLEQGFQLYRRQVHERSD